MNEKYVFEVIKVRQKGDFLEIGGLVFTTIKRGDVLSVTEQFERNEPTLLILDIITYGHHMEELDRADTGWLVVQIEGEVDLNQVKYLYKVSSNN